MRLSFIGTGLEAGVPVFGCPCPICTRARFDQAARRRPGPCLLVETADTRLLLGACPGMPGARFAERRAREAVLVPHWRPVLIHGLYALRWGAGRRIPVLGPALPLSCNDLLREPGILDPTALSPLARRGVGPFEITALPLAGSPGFGFALESVSLRLVWLAEGPGLAPEALALLGRWEPDLLVTGAGWGEGDLPADDGEVLGPVVALSERLGALRTLVSGVGHRLDRWRASGTVLLPPGVEFARDGQRLELQPPGFSVPLRPGRESAG